MLIRAERPGKRFERAAILRGLYESDTTLTQQPRSFNLDVRNAQLVLKAQLLWRPLLHRDFRFLILWLRFLINRSVFLLPAVVGWTLRCAAGDADHDDGAP